MVCDARRVVKRGDLRGSPPGGGKEACIALHYLADFPDNFGHIGIEARQGVEGAVCYSRIFWFDLV